MYIEDTMIRDALGKFLLSRGITEANAEFLGYGTGSMCHTKHRPGENFTYRMFYEDDNDDPLTYVNIPDTPTDDPETSYRGFLLPPEVDRKAATGLVDRFYRDALAEPVGKIVTSQEHTFNEHSKNWHYDACKIGQALGDRIKNKKYKDWFDEWNDRSQEHYDHIVAHVNGLVHQLKCTESDDGNVFTYSYKDTVFFLVDLDKGVVEFPACSALIKEMADRKHMNNPLLGFGLAFCAVDRYIYGPAQGMYGMFFQFAKGYMVSHYPETREWITKI